MRIERAKRIIKKARNLIAEGWVQGTLAEDGEGFRCDYREKRACRFCAQGAIARAVHETSEFKGVADVNNAHRLINTLVTDAVGVVWVQAWNDAPDRTQQDVVQGFEKALKFLETKQAEGVGEVTTKGKGQAAELVLMPGWV